MMTLKPERLRGKLDARLQILAFKVGELGHKILK